MNLRYEKLTGASIRDIVDQLAKVRIEVFGAYPYLYEGSLEYEQAYLKTYWQSEGAMVFCVYDENVLVGASTCIPLKDETDEVKAPFEAAGLDIDTIYYFGESVLLEKYRGEGIGKRFFEAREEHANLSGEFKFAYFCAVQRPNDHPLKPEGHRPLDVFWLKKGYKMSTLESKFSWKDINEPEETMKSMLYWFKELG